MPSFYQVKKSAFGAWITNFHTVASANATPLGLSPADLTLITNTKTEFVNSFNAQESARAASIGATAMCDQEWGDAVAIVSGFNARFQAIAGISPELLGELGLNVPGGGGGSIPVFAPSDLSGLGCSNGVNQLKWSRNGNESGTVYVIEAAYDGTNDWEIVDNSTRPKFDHTGQTPGRFVRYRVFAQRGTTKSNPSGTVSIYDPGAAGTMSLAA
ncbi:MAG: fibronectin type III domain-containing protein [Fimbriimonadaceae bacterium]|nr:fibronectin type III domain-containing protein [Fimbriimonadaceae bacterium]